MNPKVRFQVALSSESTATYFAFKRPFPSVDTVVHLESTLTTEHTMADDTLVGVGHLFVNVFYQLLQL